MNTNRTIHSSCWTANTARSHTRVTSSAVSSWAGFPHFTILLILALMLLSGAILANLSHAAGRVFYDGFEDGTTNKWGRDSGRNKAIAVQKGVDGGSAHSGNYFAQINFNGLVAWNDPNSYTNLLLNHWSYNKEFFIRMWWRLDKDFGSGMAAQGDGAKLLRLNIANDDYATFMLQSGGSHEQWFVNGAPFLNKWAGDNGKLLSQRSWQKVEIYVYQDNSKGIVKRWHNGQLIYTYAGRTNNSNNAPYYPLYLPSNWSSNPGWEHGANNHFYVDDVEIYSDTGVGATGSMSDATITVGTSVTQTPPNAPTNLHLQ
jgi:hypothetical protein